MLGSIIFGTIILIGTGFAFYSQLLRETKELEERMKSLENRISELEKREDPVSDVEKSHIKCLVEFLEHLKAFFQEKKDKGIVSFDDTAFTVDENGFVGLKPNEEETFTDEEIQKDEILETSS